LAQAGDVNNDKHADMIIGAHGEKTAYLIFGPLTQSLSITQNGSNSGYFSLLDSSASSAFGMSVAPAGDVNNDSFDDVVIKDLLKGSVYLIYNYQTCQSPCDHCLIISSSTCITCLPDKPYLFSGSC